MKKRKQKMLVLVTVMSSFAMGSAQAQSNHGEGLEIFPATYEGGSLGQEFNFLTKDPFLLAIESFKLERSKLVANIVITPESSRELDKLTQNFIDKRLAIVLDGSVASSPVIKTKITGTKLSISFDNQHGFEQFARILATNV